MKKINADLILRSSAIYTVVENEPISGGIAIAGNKIIAVGKDNEIDSYIGDRTRIRDLDDKLILPGLIEGHTHSMITFALAGVNLKGIDSKDKIGRMLKDWADANPDEPWIIGGGWYSANWGGEEPNRRDLDKYISDRPVALLDLDMHAGWLNTKALETAGITKENAGELSVEGEIITDPDTGVPTGLIIDHPIYKMMETSIPDYNELRHLKNLIGKWSELGVTSVNEMTPFNRNDSILIQRLKQLEDTNNLAVRQFVVFDANCMEEELIKGMKELDSDKLRLTSVKIIMDGVGSTKTAAMMQPYEDSEKWSGEQYLTEEELTSLLINTDKLGLDGRIHACGDLAVNTALNAYEIMIKTNGKKDRRSSIEHLDTMKPEDIPRLAKLEIIANMTPDFMAPTNEWNVNPYMKIYDVNTQNTLWQINTMLKNGVTVTFGTDSTTSAFNPMVQIYRAVTRVSNDGKPAGGFLPEEKISVKEAIRCYTINPAYEARMEDKLGTLEVGKLADITVLDTNILNAPVEDIMTTKTVLTIMDGKIVFERNEQCTQ